MEDIQATIHINLENSEEDLWNNLDKDARWGVKKAQKENLSVMLTESSDDFKTFYGIYKKTLIDGGIVRQEFNDLEKQSDKLFLCYKDNTVIAGSVIKIENTKTILMLNASLKEFLKYQPNNLLYWEIILWSKRNNFKIFDLGGYQINAQENRKLWHINRFKERWGGEIVEYKIESKNPFYIFGRKIIRNFPFVKNMRDRIRLRFWRFKNKNQQ
jgi:lipid II:glycine glycyltransferase (peptidoglycan interpeptide bridge formation enzyme)